MKIGFMASHGGSNMQAIIDACNEGTLHAFPSAVVSNNRESGALTRAMAEGKSALADIVTRRVVTVKPDEPLETASKRMAQHNISALPVIDSERKVLGIVTAEDVSKLLGK